MLNRKLPPSHASFILMGALAFVHCGGQSDPGGAAGSSTTHGGAGGVSGASGASGDGSGGGPDVDAATDTIVPQDVTSEARLPDDAAAPDTADTRPPRDGSTSFQSFRVGSAFGPCPAKTDCSSYIELTSDGVLHVDKEDDNSHTIYTATISPDEFAATVAIVTDPALVALLDGPPVCTVIFDVFGWMTLDIGSRVIEATTTLCMQQPIVRAGTQMRDLKKAYIP